MPYMLTPGARLEVGPHGQLEETLGSCNGCAAGNGCCGTAVGDLTITAWGHTVPAPVVLGAAAALAYVLFFRKKRRRR